MKTCIICNQTKEFIEFTNDRQKVDGKSPYCKPCNRKKNRAWHAGNRNRAKKHHLKYNYGITLEEFNLMMSNQKGKCASCDEEELNLVVDHDHITGKVRALLCESCNKAEGLLKSNPEKTRKLALYMEKYND